MGGKFEVLITQQRAMFYPKCQISNLVKVWDAESFKEAESLPEKDLADEHSNDFEPIKDAQSKYFDDVFHQDENYNSNKSCAYELNFGGQIQKWDWSGRLDRSGNRILHNYAADTYLAIDTEQKIVGGYSFILEAGYENSVMHLVTEITVE